MLSTALYVLLLDALVLVYGKEQFNCVQNMAAIFNVTSGIQKDFSGCHRCLVTFIGIKRIDLIQASQAYRLYWVYGLHTNLVKAFLSYCNTMETCRISVAETKSNILNHSIQRGYQHVTSTRESSMVDNSIYLLTASIAETEGKVAENIIYSRLGSYDKSFSIRKQVWKIPVFVESNLQAREMFSVLADQQSKASSMLHQAQEFDSDKIENILGTENLQSDRSSMRCIIIPSYHEDAVCQECVAMHSDSLSIRTYVLFYRAISMSAKLCVFRSIHESKKIIESCKKTFCSKMDTWGSSECDRVLNIFAMRQQGSEKTNDIQDDTNQRHESEISHEKRKNLKEIRQILQYLAHKRMARLSKRNAGMLQAFTFTNTLGILELNDLVCINSTSAINRNTECIGHIMKNVVGPRVVIFLAARNAIVLVARSDQITTTRKDCKLVWLKKPDCKLYLGTQLMNTEMYKIPQNPGFKASFCLISYHTPSKQLTCTRRMRHSFSLVSQEPRIDTLTKTSILIDISGLDSKKIMPLYQNMELECRQTSCVRIQEVPHGFCSEHRDFIMATPKQSPVQVVIHQFTKNRIPVGLWPPKNYINFHNVDDVAFQKSYSRYFLDSGTELRTASDSIAFVEYECEKSKQMHCVSCLLQHTEVYLSYDDKSTTRGYVWMRPALSGVLESCVGDKMCSRLTYNANRAQLERPGELRQWTV